MPHATPPWVAALTTDLVRFLVPVPQDLVQELKADQLGSLQSMAQAKVLQEVVDLRVGQERPPWRGALTTERDLVLRPVPQDLVQELYLDQPEILQSMAQAKVLQVVVWALVPQATPP